MIYNPYHVETINLMYQSLGKLLMHIKNDIRSKASKEFLSEIELAIKLHRKLLSEFEPTINEIQNITSKRWHFFYKDGSEKIRKDWHKKQNIESLIIKAEDSENYKNLSKILNNVAEKVKLEKQENSIQKIDEAIKFYNQLQIEWNGLILDVMEVRKEFNRLFDKLPSDVLKSKYLKYQELVSKGFSAKELIKIATEDGINKHEIFILIRTLFNLSVEETANHIRVFVK